MQTTTKTTQAQQESLAAGLGHLVTLVGEVAAGIQALKGAPTIVDPFTGAALPPTALSRLSASLDVERASVLCMAAVGTSDPATLVGRNLYDVVHDDDVEALQAAHLALLTGEGQQVAQVRLRAASGRWLRLSWAAASARNAAGVVTGIYAVSLRSPHPN